MEKKAKKKKPLRRIGVYFLSMLCFCVLAIFIYPSDENNTILLPDWYCYVIIFGPIIVAAFYDKLQITRRIINAIRKKRAEVIERKKYDSMSEVEKWRMERQAVAKNTKNNLSSEINLESNMNGIQAPRVMDSVTNQITVNSETHKAAMVVFETGQASVSMVQRRLKINYAPAARIMDNLERAGIVGPFSASAPRKILISKDAYLNNVNIVEDEMELPRPELKRIIEEEHEWRRLQQGLSVEQYELNKIDSMEGHTFERWCANLLLKSGFISAEVTPGSGDQGVDIVAVKDGIHYAIQCKCYSSDLGNAPIQQVYAGKEMYSCQVGVVMTNRHFTAGAKQLAEKTRVLLWDREKLAEMLSYAKQ